LFAALAGAATTRTANATVIILANM
jgi:hypothetical protein